MKACTAEVVGVALAGCATQGSSGRTTLIDGTTVGKLEIKPL
jgi:hypothetical protein